MFSKTLARNNTEYLVNTSSMKIVSKSGGLPGLVAANEKCASSWVESMHMILHCPKASPPYLMVRSLQHLCACSWADCENVLSSS